MDTGYLTSQVSTIIGQLHGLFDEIGVPGQERDARESEVGCLTVNKQEDADHISCLLRFQRRYTIMYDK